MSRLYGTVIAVIVISVAFLNILAENCTHVWLN